MKLSLLTFCSVLAFTSAATAYTTKTDTQMQTECATKWKGDSAKIKSCVNGKKGYQAKMTKSDTASGTTSSTKVKESHKESHTMMKKKPMNDDSKAMGKTSSETTIDKTKKTETMKKM